jgi:glycosyltransferase involved in cell wall biosynthesis
MKILFITPVLPYPLDSGGKIKTYQTLKQLSKKHQVWLFCFARDKKEASRKKYLEEFCCRVEVVISPYPFAQFKEIRPFIFKSLFSALPLAAFRHRHQEAQKMIEKMMRKEQFDALHIDHLNMATYLPKTKNCLWVLDEHNLEYEISWNIFKRESWNKFKVFSLLEFLKLYRFEKKMVKKFDYIFAISEADKKKLINLGVKAERIFTLPTTFELKTIKNSPPKKNQILFVGLLSWWPNKDGFFWFYHQVYDLIKKKIPRVRFIVVGNQATEEMKALARQDSSLDLVGYAKDVSRYFEESQVFVVPINSGSGIRIKILTALSYGLPVVSTTKGAEGVVSKSSGGVILADSPEEFAESVIKILKDNDYAKKMAAAGREFTHDNYRAEMTRKALEKVYG